uniref:Glycosyl transferase family 51 n=1 Tax=uncultured Thiotrichaceae bacterium TaxID=298394 RepID=A0A6S6U434_9GAMM|nr:MAG: Glycosyl transferase family 51 [uncultured Thiotrichaceae bacterium]
MLMLLFTAFIIMTAYYRGEIKTARQQTAQLVADASQRHGTEIQPWDLSSQRKSMILAIEDPSFMSHQGVDFETPGAGVTTISQGLVKLLYFPDGFKPGIAKMRQTLIARYAFDPMVSKDEQLQLFLNMSYLGHVEGKAVHGFANAAEVYFDKPYAELMDEEFMSLVVMLIGPNGLKPGTGAHQERMARVEAYLVPDREVSIGRYFLKKR